MVLLSSYWCVERDFEIVQGKSVYKFVSSKYVAFAWKMNLQMKAP